LPGVGDPQVQARPKVGDENKSCRKIGGKAKCPLGVLASSPCPL